MKLSKKLLKSIIAAVAIIVVVIVAFIFFGPSVKRTIITTSTLREVVSISELSTGEFCYNGVVSIPEKNRRTDFKIDRKNKSVTPIIPEIKINDVIINDGSISTIPENATAKLKDTLSYCKEDALKEANQNEKLVETAKSNLQDSITALLTPLLKEAGYKIMW